MAKFEDRENRRRGSIVEVSLMVRRQWPVAGEVARRRTGRSRSG